MNKILVFVDCPDGRITATSIEAIAFAQKLGSSSGAEVEAATLSATADQAGGLGRFRLDRAIAVTAPSLEEYTPGNYCLAMEECLQHMSPDLVILPHTYQTMDLAPRLAARLGVPLVTDCVGCRVDDTGALLFTRPMYRSKLLADLRVQGRSPWIMTLQKGAASADNAQEGVVSIETLASTAANGDSRRQSLQKVGLDQKRVDLAKAEVIIGAGRGVRKKENLALLEELAEVLGGELGASRPVVDNEWLDRDRQIGSSGQNVAPRLYVAVGISGAIQHVVGMKNSGCIVAINSDPQAPIFNLATYGIVGDMAEVVPALTKKLRETGGQG